MAPAFRASAGFRATTRFPTIGAGSSPNRSSRSSVARPTSQRSSVGGIGGRTGLDGGGLDRKKGVARCTGGEDPISAGLSSENAGVGAMESGDRPSSSWLGDNGRPGSAYDELLVERGCRLKADSRLSLLAEAKHFPGPPPRRGPSGTGVGARGISCK